MSPCASQLFDAPLSTAALDVGYAFDRMARANRRPTEPELAEGMRLIDRYTILDRIGSGGMATIYRATDDRLDRVVLRRVQQASELYGHERHEPGVCGHRACEFRERRRIEVPRREDRRIGSGGN